MKMPPKSVYEKAGGMMYFPRMVSKIRLYASGELRPDFHQNLGKGADGWCIGFLRVNYEELRNRVLAGGTDEEILQWCFEKGRSLSEIDLMVWNSFISKLGWKDLATPRLEKYKQESGLAERKDIMTMPEFFEVDEGRKA
ncbi:MAG: hypothetical protein JWM16_3641 [Verrucomicrobiales bacterium]|nr:hypothetical protein [Verrucomicrobiales bacterium]